MRLFGRESSELLRDRAPSITAGGLSMSRAHRRPGNRLDPESLPWTGRNVVFPVACASAAYALVCLAGPLRRGDPASSALERTAALAGAFVLPALAVLALGALRSRRAPGEDPRLWNPGALWFPRGQLCRDVVAGLVLGLLLLFMNGISIRAKVALPGGPEVPASGLASTVWSSSTLGEVSALLLALGLVAPAAEEVFFRGVLYPALRRVLSVVPAVVLSSSAFGAAHLDLMRLHAFLLGLVAAILVEYTGSLAPAVLAHMGANIGFVLFYANGGRLALALPSWALIAAFAAMNVVFFLLGQPLFGGPEEDGVAETDG
jgi:membrane protease YdiL (CAAX protease family)